MSHRYDLDSLTVRDPIETVRAMESRFFRGGSFDLHQLIALVVEEVLCCGAEDVEVWRSGGWWAIGSTYDWLVDDGADVAARSFERIQSYRQGGPNSMRSEVLVAAFCRDVATFATSGATIVKGESPTGVLVPQSAARVVAFRV